MSTHLFRVRWTRPTWVNQSSPSTRLYVQAASARRLADRLAAGGAIVTVDTAERGPWAPLNNGGEA